MARSLRTASSARAAHGSHVCGSQRLSYPSVICRGARFSSVQVLEPRCCARGTRAKTWIVTIDDDTAVSCAALPRSDARDKTVSATCPIPTASCSGDVDFTRAILPLAT